MDTNSTNPWIMATLSCWMIWCKLSTTDYHTFNNSRTLFALSSYSSTNKQTTNTTQVWTKNANLLLRLQLAQQSWHVIQHALTNSHPIRRTIHGSHSKQIWFLHAS